MEFPTSSNNVDPRIWLKNTDISPSYIPAFNPTRTSFDNSGVNYTRY